MISRTFKNWPWKLLSFILAFVLWFMIINYQDPEIKKKINNIEVKVINEDAITSKNKAVNYLEGTEIKLDVKGKRSIVGKLNKDDIVVTADLSKVSITGAVDLDINLPLGVDLVNAKPSVMMISMETIKSYLRVCTPFYKGELDEGFIKLSPVLSPNQIEITGTQSRLALISSVVVPINIDGANSDINLFVKPQILDSFGNEIEGLEISDDKIKVQLPIQKVKDVPILVKPQGKMKDGLRLNYIKPSQISIKVRGKKESIDKFKYVEISNINLSNLDENSNKIKVDLSKYLPDEISLMDSEEFYINVDVDKLIEKTFTIYSSEIERVNTKENIEYDFEDTNIRLYLRGTEQDLSEISLENLKPNIDFDGFEQGTHFCEVNINLRNTVELLNNNLKMKVKLLDPNADNNSEDNNDN